MRTYRINLFWAVGLVTSLSLAIAACGPDFSEAGLGTEIEFKPDRPEIPTTENVTPYTGGDLYVQEAQERYRTGLDVHRKIIWRTCTPNDGVCHNKKEYPDLHTPANLIAAINAPCNVQPGEWQSVYNRCERSGDAFRFNRGDFTQTIEVGWLEYIPGEPAEYGEGNLPTLESPGIHVQLRENVPTDRQELWADGQFLREFEGSPLLFANFETRWWIIDGNHLFAEVQNYQTDRADALDRVGVRQGDLNRDGVFGADEDAVVPMIAPGDPEGSYLIARMRGEMHGESVPGSRMPLANQPLNISEMLALFCFVENLPVDGIPDLSAPVDYSNCSYSESPESLNLLGEGVTWEARISKILEANCGGCHGGASPDADLDLTGDGTYDRLLEASIQNPELNLIAPGNLENSYLWQKLNPSEFPEIVGLPMPYNPLTGEGKLTEAELGDISTWIVAGAVKDE